MEEEINNCIRGIQGEERPLWLEKGRRKGRKAISIELCYAPGTVPGTLRTLSHLTLRITL